MEIGIENNINKAYTEKINRACLFVKTKIYKITDDQSCIEDCNSCIDEILKEYVKIKSDLQMATDAIYKFKKGQL